MVNNLIKRIISGALLVGIFTSCAAYGGYPLGALLFFILILMLFEWNRMNFPSQNLCKKSKKNILLYIFGDIYIIIPMLYWIIFPSCNILFILFIVWCSDTFSYIGGKILKGPKLAPKISPGKTWSGTICGIIIPFVIYCILTKFETFYVIKHIPLCKFLIMLLCSPLGDLVESKAKRILNVKDSGGIIPGHGGTLDRFDSFLLVSYAYILI
jgi:phosphatidate cytidylyltransferase